MRTVRCSGRLGGEALCLNGRCLPEGGYTPFWTEFLTCACENITFPQLLLSTVIKWQLKLCKRDPKL